MRLTDMLGGPQPHLPARPKRSMSRFADRYDIVKTLKTGNGVSTYLAVDSVTAEQVVLKTFDPAALHAGTQARFLHETRVLRELSGVGVCALHDAGQTDTHLYLTQQYAPGVTLEHALLDGPLSVVATLRAGIAIAAALDLAHCAGIFHRDIKPANIVVDGQERDGTFSSVTLIDFGFARSPWMDESIRDDLVGTVRYLSPEAAGMLPVQADERSDLYAFGVVLFECLAGRPPFDSESVGDLLRQHLSAPVPEIRRADDPVPTALAAVVQRLLRKDPAERYQSAEAVGADLAQIRAALRAGDPDPSIVIGRHDRRLTLTDPAFVGRETELAGLTSLVATLTQDTPGVILLDADSGGGKSRLLAEVSSRVQEVGITVLQGQGVALGGQRPFTLLHGVADGIVAMFADDPVGRGRLIAELADVAPAIVRALPALQELFGEAGDRDPGPEQFGELRSLVGMRRLLAAVAGPSRPLLLVLDDCQWSDVLTVRLLRYLFAESEHAPSNLGVVAAFRSEEVPAAHPLRLIDGARTVHLGPLSNRSVGLLAESMAGPLPDEAVDTVVRLAGGNPFMATAVLRGLVESAALIAEPDGWRVDPTRLPDAQAARRAAAFLVKRLELLGPAAVRLLSVGAVLGKQFDIVTATRIAGNVVDAGTILADARRRRLLWIDDDAGTCTFSHDKIREALLARLDSDVRFELHGLAADALIAQDDGSAELAFDLAYHLSEAGRPADALPYAIAAAELARDRYALDVAVVHYRMAADAAGAAGTTDPATRRRLAEGLGDVLMLQGGYEEARRQLTEARALVDARSHAAEIDGKLGALAFKQGDIPTAKRHLEGALGLLGRRIPGRVLLLPFLLWELLVQVTHTVLPGLTTGRRPAAGREADFLAMRMYSRLAYLYWFHSGKATCAWAHLRGMNLAERFQASPELGQAWSEHAPVMTMLPWYGRGIDYAQRSLSIRRELGDVWGQGQSLNFTGVARYAASDFDGAQLACEEAVRLLRRTGDQWEVNTASWNLALCLLRKGNLRDTVEIAVETFETARAIGDRTAAGIALSIWARATEGRVPPELIRQMLDHGSEDAQTTAELHLADALVQRRNGDLDSAIACLERTLQTIRAAGLRQEYIAPAFPWYATLLRERAEATPLLAPDLRAKRLREAARAARRAMRWARAYRNNVPHAYREAAIVASLRGHARRALRLLDRSAVVAVRNGGSYEQAQTRLVRAQLIAAHAGTARDAEVISAQVALESLDPLLGRAAADDDAEQSSKISIFDRFAALLHAGRSIGAAPTEIALEGAIRESTTALLRAERCHLVPAAALTDNSLTTQSGENMEGHSRSLLVRAAESGTPVVAMGEAFTSTDSLVLSGIRSALAAPILVNGQIRSFLYVTHRQLGELFGDDEIQLAAFVATLSGAAYEHLLGSETRFRALVQSSSDVVTLVDGSGTVGYQSAALEAVFGLPPNRMLGLPLSAWVHPEDVEGLERAVAEATDGRGSVTVECRLGHADGSYRSAESVITNLLDEPTVAALVINTRDITDRKLAADQLRLVEDRERIARDLHDVVIQRLFAVGLRLDSLSGRISEPHSAQVLSATEELHHTIRDIRGAIFSLRVDTPSDPLTSRVRAIVERASESLGFSPSVEFDDALDVDVPEVLHPHLLATVNEALSNVARHARATSVAVRIAVEDGHLVASVVDDGRGLPLERTESGMANLRRRAEVVGGVMTVGPGPHGRGTALRWRVPVTRPDKS